MSDAPRREGELEAEIARLRRSLAVAERRARDDESRYGLILNSAVDYGIIALDLDGLVTEWNEGASRIMGWTAEEMLAKPAAIFFTPEDRQAGTPQKEMTAALDQGRGNDERWHLRKDGSRFWAAGEMMPLRDATGAVQGFIKVLRDRTEQRSEAEKTRADAEFLRSVLASSGDCIKVLDLDGKLTFMNEGGYQIMEVGDFNAIRGCPWTNFWQGVGSADAKAALVMAQRGEVGRFQGAADTMLGNPRWWDVQVTPILGSDGRPERILSVSRDITSTKLGEARRAALFELSDRFADLNDAASLTDAACRILGQVLSVQLVGYGLVDPRAETITVERDWTTGGASTLAGTLNFRDFGSYIDDLKRGETVVVTDARQDARTKAFAPALEARSARAFVNTPVFESGQLVALQYVSTDQPREWTDGDLLFIREVALRTRAATARRQAECALQTSEAHWRGLFERLSEGFVVGKVVRDATGAIHDWRYVDVNAAWGELVGIEPTSVIGRTIREALPGIEDAWIDEFADVVRTGQPVAFTRQVGSLNRWYEGRAFALDDESFGVIFLEVTDRVWAEGRRAALLRLGESLRNLDDTEAMADAAAEIVGRTLRANASGYGRIDESDERLIVERGWSATPGYSVAGEYAMRDYGTYIDDLLGNRTVAIADTWSDERTVVHRKGFEAIGIRALINAPVVEKGRLSALFCVLSDVIRHWTDEEVEFVQQAAEQTRIAIERRRAEQALQRLATSLQEQVEERTRERDRTWRLSRDMLGVANEEGVWLSVNPAWSTILGWPEDAFVGRTSEWLEHPDDSAKTRAEVGRLADGQTTLSFENRFRRRSGGYCDLLWSAVPVEGKLYCVARDVTDQKEREAELATTQVQLAQSHKMEAVGQLTGGLAHDFNNLLAVITGSLELLERRISQGRLDDIERFTSASQTAAKRATSLTHRLLAFSRRQTLDPRLTDANALMNGMADLIRRTVGPEIKVEIEGSPDLWTTLVDPNQLENALLNLCINARDAMPGGGQIMVEASNKALDKRSARLRDLAAGEFVVLSVSDTGTGMPPDVVARVFEPFFTTKPIGQGTGLGLSMVYGFARQSDGQVRIHSEVGKGTTINIYLPRAHGTSKQADESAPMPVARARAGQTVLVVDDEASVRMLVVDVLEELGYTAVEAHDGQAGLKILESDLRVDLLVTDVGMPGMNGRQLADAARVFRPGLKVMFITGYAEAAVVSHGHLEPGMVIVTKPFSLEDLAQRMKALIEL